MNLVFIYGMPATGKLTVAKELAALTGYRLFHNHLAVDLLLPVFEFGSPGFVRLREEIWLLVFAEACRSGNTGMIFTFAPENSVSEHFADNATELLERLGGSVDFVSLECPLAEIHTRISAPSRSSHGKLTSAEHFDVLCQDGVFNAPQMPPARVTIATSTCSPAEAARQIVRELGLPEFRAVPAG